MWRVYYDDGTTWDPHDLGPSQAPRLGVIAIVQYTEHEGRSVYSGEDYYWWDEDGTWRGGDLFGMFDYLIRPGFKVVLFGRLIHNGLYKDICDRAHADPGIPEGVTPGWSSQNS